MGSVIKPHDCVADSQGNPAGAQFQDKMYGPGMRLFNFQDKKKTKKSAAPAEGVTAPILYRCTICKGIAR